MRRRRARRASRSPPPCSKLSPPPLLHPVSLSLSLSPSFFGSDCEFKKQNPQQLKEKTHLHHNEKSSAQSIAEFRPSTAALSAAGGTGQGANVKEPMPGEHPGERGTGRSGCQRWLKVTGLFPPTQQTPDTFYQPWGAGGLVWIYHPFFFPSERREVSFPLLCFYFLFSF